MKRVHKQYTKQTQLSKMKKILLVSVAFCLVAFVGSCSKSNENAQEQAGQDSTMVSAEQQTPVADETHGVVRVLSNSDKAEATDKPLVIDFSATWCGPCHRFKPTFDQVAEEYADRANFASADVDECTDLASAYKIESIPFVLILNPDGTSASQTGLMSEKEFKAFLDKNLK